MRVSRSVVVVAIFGLTACSSRRTTVSGDDASPADAADPPPADQTIPTRDANEKPLPACAEIHRNLDAEQLRMRLSPMHAKQVLIADDLSHAVIADDASIEVIDLLSDDGSFELYLNQQDNPSSPKIQWALQQTAIVYLTDDNRLALHNLDQGPMDHYVLSEDACDFRVDPTGRHVLAITNCSSRFVGDLQHFDLHVYDEGPDPRHLDDVVDIFSVVFSADGERAAFVSNLQTTTPACDDVGGTLMLAELDSDKLSPLTAGLVVPDSVMFVRPDLLLYRRPVGCDAVLEQQLVAYDLKAQAFRELGSGRFYGSRSMTGEAAYRATPDGRWVLGADSRFGDSPEKLFAVPTDGGEARLLADDLLLQILIMSSINPFPYLTADGSHAIYQQFSSDVAALPALIAVRLSDNQKTTVARGAALQAIGLSPGSASVVVPDISLDPDGSKELLYVNLKSGTKPQLLAKHRGIHTARILPGDHGVLMLIYDEKSKQQQLSACLQAPGGGVCQLFSSWKSSALGGGYEIAPDACFVVYDTDLGDEPGTYLAPIFLPI